MNAPLSKKLNEVKWGEFKITDIFDVKNTHNILSNEIVEKSGNVPYLCASAEKNGVSTYISYNDDLIDKGNCIFIGGKTFVVTYQENDFFSNDSHNLALYLKFSEKRKKDVQIFIASCITRSVGYKYSWGNSISHKKIQNDYVSLPVTPENKIDFDFMEAFIRELEEERIRELAAYLKVSGFDNYKLSKCESEALAHFNELKWKEFNLIDIFDVKNTHNILSNEIKKDSGNVPYLCASSVNNGVSSYISYKEELVEKGNCIFIGGKTFVVSYQEKDFFSNDSHNLALYVKDLQPTKLNQLYLATCVYKGLSHKYTWGDSISGAKIKSDKIMLPIASDGSPDYAFMETFISAVQKLVIKDVVLYANKKIAATKQAVHKNPSEYGTDEVFGTLKVAEYN